MLSHTVQSALPKVIPYKTYSSQSVTPEPVSLLLFGGGPVLMFEWRPIPQWFRLKSDTKIQVRCWCSLDRMNVLRN